MAPIAIGTLCPTGRAWLIRMAPAGLFRAPGPTPQPEEKRVRDAVIVDAVRTPIGKRNGSLAGIHPAHLSAHVLRALAERTGVEPAEIDDVIWGCVSQVADQSGNIGRIAVLAAGWPESVPSTTVDRRCGSSQQAVHFAAGAGASGPAPLAEPR